MEMNEHEDQGYAAPSWRDYLSDPRLLALGAFILGLVIGLPILGWQVWPVEWTDATVNQLTTEAQEEYARLVVDSYAFNGDEETALRRLEDLGPGIGPQLLETIAADPGEQSLEAVAILKSLTGVSEGEAALPGESGTQSEDDSRGSPTFIIFCTLGTVVLVVGALVYYFRQRTQGREPTAAMQAQEYTRQAPQTDFVALGESPPISQWMTTYLIGDDLFDDSFSIDTPAGEFMGECGVGIADTIGVGEPKRVSAFEIWLFDKNDIQTVTKVLMSEHTYNDDAIREKMAAKGDPELALPGQEVILETETLQMVARVVDMSYGAGALPDNSFFERGTIELAIWQK
jgi:hypothetical protein